MSDQPVNNQAAPLAEPAKPTATTQEKTGGKTYTDEEVQQIVQERLKREQEKLKDAERRAAEKAQAEAAAAQGEWKKVAEQREKEAAELKARLDAIELLNKKRAIASKYGLPDLLSERLTGSTDEEIDADAKRLAELMPKSPKPAPGPVNPGANGQMRETDAQKRSRIYGDPSAMFDPEVARKAGGGVIYPSQE